jgi:hypothetical protein
VNLSGARILSPAFGGEKYSPATHVIAEIANSPAPRFSQPDVVFVSGKDFTHAPTKAKDDRAIESNAIFFEFFTNDPYDINCITCLSSKANCRNREATRLKPKLKKYSKIANSNSASLI